MGNSPVTNLHHMRSVQPSKDANGVPCMAFHIRSVRVPEFPSTDNRTLQGLETCMQSSQRVFLPLRMLQHVCMHAYKSLLKT